MNIHSHNQGTQQTVMIFQKGRPAKVKIEENQITRDDTREILFGNTMIQLVITVLYSFVLCSLFLRKFSKFITHDWQTKIKSFKVFDMLGVPQFFALTKSTFMQK